MIAYQEHSSSHAEMQIQGVVAFVKGGEEERDGDGDGDEAAVRVEVVVDNEQCTMGIDIDWNIEKWKRNGILKLEVLTTAEPEGRFSRT